jgi:prolyl oligopeptidase
VPPGPVTRAETRVDAWHGVPVADPYRWLEDGGADEVQAWTRAQSEYARARLDRVAGRAGLGARLAQLLGAGALGTPAPRRGRIFFQRRRGAQQQPVLYVRDGLHGTDRELIDPATLSPDGASALDWYYPSRDGRLLAYGVSDAGSEMSTLRVLEVDSGRRLDDVVPFTRACSLAWRPDGEGFIYTRYPAPGSVPAGEERFHRHVFEHALGRDWRDDACLFGPGREPTDWPVVALSPAGRFLSVTVQRGWSACDVYLADRVSGGGFVPVAEGLETLFDVTPRDERLYLLTNHDAPRCRLLGADPRRPGPESWVELLPESPATGVLESAAVIGARVVAVRLERACARVTLHDLDGAPRGEVALPGIGSVSALGGEWDGHELFLGFSSFTTPPCVLHVDLDTPGVRGEAGARVVPAVWERVETRDEQGAAVLDPDDYVVRVEDCASKDGTRVSMFLVHRRGRPSDGRGPALLGGYGGFSVSVTPEFTAHVLPFLDRGGLYAVAQLRGGGEHGEPWHRAGMLAHKQNVFDDFIAAAEYLVAAGHAAPGRLAIRGGSNGGLLVAAALTQRPELFRAVVCQVPLADMLRYHHFRLARLWISEYGSADDPDAFRWLHAYSPYHRVVDGTPYPAVLVTAGEQDSRVDPMHARKLAARLQAASSSGRPVLLRVEPRAGHGQGKPVSKQLEELTDVWAFLYAELGLAG